MEDFFTFLLDSAWKTRVQWFREFNKKAAPQGTVFVGDSLTQEFPIHELLSLNKDERVFEIHNRGIGGDTTKGVLKRLQESILDLNPARIFLLIGTNDLGNGIPLNAIIENYAEILSQSYEHCPGVEIFIISLFPVNSQDEGTDSFTVGIRTNEAIRELNQRLIVLAENNNAKYLDLHSILSDKKGNLKQELTRDGLHLNHLGYEVVLKAVMNC